MRAWLAVASADHVRRGVAGGFMQVGHGKAAPLRRMSPGDGVAYYAPTERFGEKQPCRAFVALGTVRDGAAYQVEASPAFNPWRRDVDWLADTQPVPIEPLLPQLSFTAGRANWGAALRFGFLAITPTDFELIRAAMSRR